MVWDRGMGWVNQVLIPYLYNGMGREWDGFFLVGWDFRGTTLWDGIFIGYPMISKHITLYFLKKYF